MITALPLVTESTNTDYYSVIYNVHGIRVCNMQYLLSLSYSRNLLTCHGLLEVAFLKIAPDLTIHATVIEILLK